MMARTASRVSSSVPPVGTRKSARAAFSASGHCLATIASNLSGVMPGRARTRARCTSAGAETTTTVSTRDSPPVSNSRGMSKRIRGASAYLARNASRSSPTAGWTMASNRRSAAVIVQHPFTQHRAIDPARPCRPGKGLLDRPHQTAIRALQAVHRGIGVEHRYALFGEHRRDGRFAHADRAGQPDPDHATNSARSASSRASSRGGATPKNNSNASAAWPISMSSPSTVSSPRDRAAASNGVSSGA